MVRAKRFTGADAKRISKGFKARSSNVGGSLVRTDQLQNVRTSYSYTTGFNKGNKIKTEAWTEGKRPLLGSKKKSVVSGGGSSGRSVPRIGLPSIRHKRRIKYADVTPGHAPIVGTSAKTLFVLFIYMILLSSTTFVFQSAYADYERFEQGITGVMSGDSSVSTDYDYGIPERHFGHDYDDSLTAQQIERLKLLNEVQEMEDLHGGKPRLQSLYGIPFWDVMMYPDGTIIGMDKYNEYYPYENEDNWWEGVKQFFGTIVDTFAYMINYLTFNFQAGVELPIVISWLPFMMALPVWIYIGLLVAPYAIEALKSIAQVIDAIVPF